MFTKSVVAPEDREVSVPVLEQKITLEEISDASSAEAGMLLLTAFAGARSRSATVHDTTTASGREANDAIMGLYNTAIEDVVKNSPCVFEGGLIDCLTHAAKAIDTAATA